MPNQSIFDKYKNFDKSFSSINEKVDKARSAKDPILSKQLRQEKKALTRRARGIYSEGGAEVIKTGSIVGKFVKKHTDKNLMRQSLKQKPLPGLKYVAPGPENAFLGVRMSKPAIGLAIAGIAGASIISGIRGTADPIQRKYQPQPEYAGKISGLSYDAVGNIDNGSRTLGATGDLVFGLHNMRRG